MADHMISLSVDAAICRAESPDLNPTIADRQKALDDIEDALTEATVVALEAARIRLYESSRPRGCQGCGWPIDTVALQWYCRICDPSGKREEIRVESELFEQHGI
jgi:hypothetical protein